MVSIEWGGGSRHSPSSQAEPCGWGEPGKGEDRTGEEVETEEVAKEEEALGEALLLVQEFLCPPPPPFVASCCQKLLLGPSCHPEPLALRSPVLWAAVRLAGAAASI